MTEVVQVDIIEPICNGNEITSISSPSIMVPSPSTPPCSLAISETKMPAETIENNINEESEKNMSKTLLSTSSSPSPTAAASTTTTVVASAPSATIESMITKEVNDTQLNLTKILYEPDKGDSMKEKDQESSAVNGLSNGGITDPQIVDDDDRLVIDISDDERRDGAKNRKRPSHKPKSMPLLGLTEESTAKSSKSSAWSSSRCHRTNSLKIHLIKKRKTSSRTTPAESKPLTLSFLFILYRYLSLSTGIWFFSLSQS